MTRPAEVPFLRRIFKAGLKQTVITDLRTAPPSPPASHRCLFLNLPVGTLDLLQQGETVLQHDFHFWVVMMS